MTKGTLAPGFTVGFGEDRIAVKPAARYLGVWLDSKGSFKEHIGKVVLKDGELFSKLRGAFGHQWGISTENVARLYRGVFIPRFTHGARFWGRAATKTSNAILLNRVQRKALIGITCAYKTAPTDALQVIAGVLPLDLEANLQGAKARARSLPPNDSSREVLRATEEAYDNWQRRWNASNKGRWTYSFFPSVRDRCAKPIWLNHQLTQVLSGHGNFNHKLASFNLVESPMCACGTEPETIEHFLWRCPSHIRARERLELQLHRAGHLAPCENRVLVSSRALFSALDSFVQAALSVPV